MKSLLHGTKLNNKTELSENHTWLSLIKLFSAPTDSFSVLSTYLQNLGPRVEKNYRNFFRSGSFYFLWQIICWKWKWTAQLNTMFYNCLHIKCPCCSIVDNVFFKTTTICKLCAQKNWLVIGFWLFALAVQSLQFLYLMKPLTVNNLNWIMPNTTYQCHVR